MKTVISHRSMLDVESTEPMDSSIQETHEENILVDSMLYMIIIKKIKLSDFIQRKYYTKYISTKNIIYYKKKKLLW